MTKMHYAAALAALFALSACSNDPDGPDPEPDTAVDTDVEVDTDDDTGADIEDDTVEPDTTEDTQDEEVVEPVEAELIFDLGAITGDAGFFDLPWPSDLRMDPDGTLNITGLVSVSGVALYDQVALLADELVGAPQMPVAYFRFTGAVAPQAIEDVFTQSDDLVVILDIDPDSDEYGRVIPSVAYTLERDRFTPENVLGVMARPGIVLRPNTQYGVFVRTELNDVEGDPLIPAAAMTAALSGESDNADLNTLYAPLATELDGLSIALDDVAAATVFTTGDVVAELAELSEGVRAAHSVTIDGLAFEAAYEGFCAFHGTIDMPQFQRGVSPFNSEGRFELGADGLPIVQSTVTIPVVLTFPMQEMPADGFPLILYSHGSGGLSTQLVDRGPFLADGSEVPGEGPAFVMAPHGFGMASSALPVNPERGGTTDYAYLNFNNMSAFRDTFRQGVIEERLFLDALEALEMDPAIAADCTGLALPDGATAYGYDLDPLFAMGQSMGGMYTNMLGAVEPRIEAVVPTGAGGYWSFMLLHTDLIEGVAGLVQSLLGTRAELTPMHPVLHTLEMGWQPAEPFVYMPRLGRDPLAGHPARDIYECVGDDDHYFPPIVYDAVVLAYEHPQVGEIIWSEMQDALALIGLDGIRDYEVRDNLSTRAGDAYTGIVVQYPRPELTHGHNIFQQYDDVKYQYGCFFSSYLATGTATIPAPAALGTPCPGME